MRKVAKAIKGTSTHAIDRKLHSHEAVWQEESFDHVLRSSESLDAKIDYVLQNPVRKGLVRIAREYPWSWRKPMDHQDRSRRGGCPHPPSDAEHRKTLASTARQPGRRRSGLREPWWLGAVKVQSQTENPARAESGAPSGSRRRLRWATSFTVGHPPGNGKGWASSPGRQTKRQPLSARPERDVSYSCILSFARTSMRYRFPNKSSTSMRTDISDGLCLTTQMQEPELPFRNMGQQ